MDRPTVGVRHIPFGLSDPDEMKSFSVSQKVEDISFGRRGLRQSS